MSRKTHREKLRGQFVPLFYETLNSPAYKATSFGARSLFTALRMQFFSNSNNNGSIFRSLRDAARDIGHKDRSDIANWFRELQHYGLIVQTTAGCLGIDGKGKSPHWRITDLPTRDKDGQSVLATKDFLKWDGVLFEPHVRPSRRWKPGKVIPFKKQNPGRHVSATVDGTCLPDVVGTCLPPSGQSGSDVSSI
jgi:hypothetical protein